MDKEYECPNCGKPLVYDKNLEGYYCIDCNEFHPISEFTNEAEDDPFSSLYNELDCMMCGKRVIVSKNFNYDVCPFCYNNFIEITKGVKDFKPKFIIPFNDTLEKFKEIYLEKAKAQGVPSSILNSLSVDSIKGVFYPFHVYTIENTTNAFLSTEEEDDFYRRMSSYVEKLEVCVDTTKVFSNKQLSAFADYNFKKLDMFFPNRLGEFYTLPPINSSDESWEVLKQIILEFSEDEMKKNKTKTEKIKEIHVYNDIKNIARRLILVPIWMIEFKGEEKTHYLYVNGQTYTMISDVEYERPVKKGLFGKVVIDNHQIKVLEREKLKNKEFKSSIEYLNELRKFSVNKNDRLADIRKIR